MGKFTHNNTSLGHVRMPRLNPYSEIEFVMIAQRIKVLSLGVQAQMLGFSGTYTDLLQARPSYSQKVWQTRLN